MDAVMNLAFGVSWLPFIRGGSARLECRRCRLPLAASGQPAVTAQEQADWRKRLGRRRQQNCLAVAYKVLIWM